MQKLPFVSCLKAHDHPKEKSLEVPTVVPLLVAAQLLSAYLSLFFSSAPSDLTNSPIDLDGHSD